MTAFKLLNSLTFSLNVIFISYFSIVIRSQTTTITTHVRFQAFEFTKFLIRSHFHTIRRASGKNISQKERKIGGSFPRILAYTKLLKS